MPFQVGDNAIGEVMGGADNYEEINELERVHGTPEPQPRTDQLVSDRDSASAISILTANSQRNNIVIKTLKERLASFGVPIT